MSGNNQRHTAAWWSVSQLILNHVCMAQTFFFFFFFCVLELTGEPLSAALRLLHIISSYRRGIKQTFYGDVRHSRRETVAVLIKTLQWQALTPDQLSLSTCE